MRDKQTGEKRRAITVLDAAMGRALSTKGVEIPGTIWSANALIVAPDVVVDIHRENIAAGARIITTNTYGVIRSDLAKENIEDQFIVLNQLAGELAQRAVRESGKSNLQIAGSLPPLNGSFRPDRVLEREITDPLYREQAGALADYVDLFICETMSTITEGLSAAEAALSTGKPVIVAFTLHDEKPGCLKSGELLQDAVKALSHLELLGVMANCSLPERVSDAMPVLVSSGLEMVGGYANTFTKVPKDFLLDGEKETDRKLDLRDDLPPEYYVKFVEEWVANGANIVGGCCGTTSAHTKAICTHFRLSE
ncbi:MAG: S-methylmethionine-dependent homocysteine/selenocysteine methylase [Candidatus Azotimanducaceae bacterium]|jgi:S-methylmethionine-dependent homocysteine/selenocysteine methylase